MLPRRAILLPLMLFGTLFFGTLSAFVRRERFVNTEIGLSGETRMAAFIGQVVDPYKSSTFVGHSLWMVPSGAAKEAYFSIVSETALELGTFQFLPHITLVAAMMTGENDVVERTKELAAELAPYEFEFDNVSQHDAYFQSVFAKFKLTKEVIDANALAREFFPERKTDPDYMPHLSLVYGDIDRYEKEIDIIPELQQKLEDEAPRTNRFMVDTIEVWSTQGHVKDWYLVETIPLQGVRQASN